MQGKLTDRKMVIALVKEMGLSKKDAYFMLIDAGEWQDDGTADDLFTVEFLETYPA